MLELNKIYCADCLELMKLLPENSVDSIVTDPPYELGFMGKSWDNTGIANNPEMWKECLRVLKPWGHLLAFSGTRTYHRMASAIEDAGFEVRDMIEWVYGSGFPKSLNIGKAVDKLQGNERSVVGKDRSGSKRNCMAGDFTGGEYDLTKGTSEWEGWGTALKPAHEPICMARKPLDRWWKIKDDGKKIMGRVMTVAENVLKWGTGGINIDESRVESKPRLTGTLNKGEEIKAEPTSFKGSGTRKLQTGYDEKMAESNLGRFPANLIHDNSEEVRECFPETKSGAVKQFTNNGANQPINLWGGMLKPTEWSQGNASRFFKSIIYQAKASKSERNKGCEELEERKSELNSGGIGRKISVEKRLADGDGVNAPKSFNTHPTVKPIALMEYLIKMVTPKGGIVLDPFAGSGSTLVAAKQNGYQYIGCELTEEYIPIIEARLNAVEETKEKQTSLF